MKILVIGGAGFIGSHLCEKLVATNEVISLDNYSTGSKLNHIDGVNYIEGHAKNIDKLIKFSPDIVFHLGEYARVEQSFEDLEILWDYNKLSILPVLNFCKKNNSKIIYAGSSTKFANDGNGKNQSPYAWVKATNTELVKQYDSWYGLNFAIVYFYNVFGGREISSGKYATVIARFTEKFKKGHPLDVVSPGTQRRNFTHIDDTINGLLLVAEHGSGDDYGIGDRRDYSIIEIAKMFGSEVRMLSPRKGNRLSGGRVRADKLESLGWKPQNSVLKYIERLKKNVK